VDESILRNLDTQHRRLAEIEADAARLLAGDTYARSAELGRSPGRYDELTATNDAVRADRGWDNVDLDVALTPALRAAYEQWEDRHRAGCGLRRADRDRCHVVRRHDRQCHAGPAQEAEGLAVDPPLGE
jgi:hypothetical protein